MNHVREHVKHEHQEQCQEIQPVGRRTPPSGFAFFAATMMIMVGVFQAIQGLVACSTTPTSSGEKWTSSSTSTTWGWIHLLFGRC